MCQPASTALLGESSAPGSAALAARSAAAWPMMRRVVGRSVSGWSLVTRVASRFITLGVSCSAEGGYPGATHFWQRSVRNLAQPAPVVAASPACWCLTCENGAPL